MKLHWYRNSHWQYSADIGLLHVSVRRRGIAKRGMQVFWMVDQVCGKQFFGDTQFGSPEEAMEHAERLVDKLLTDAVEFFRTREPGKGAISRGS